MRKFSIDELNAILEEESKYELSDKAISTKTAMMGVMTRPEVLARISASQTNRFKDADAISAKTRKRISEGTKNGLAKPDVRRRQVEGTKAALNRPETKAKLIAVANEPKMKAFRREVQLRQVTCPHCGKVGAVMIMPRWHFENCKHRA